MLTQNGYFPDIPIIEKKALWAAYSGDSLNAFIIDCVIREGDEKVYTDDILRKYLSYCLTNGQHPLPEKAFWQHFPRRIDYTVHQDTAGTRRHYVKGITIKE